MILVKQLSVAIWGSFHSIPNRSLPNKASKKGCINAAETIAISSWEAVKHRLYMWLLSQLGVRSERGWKGKFGNVGKCPMAPWPSVIYILLIYIRWVFGSFPTYVQRCLNHTMLPSSSQKLSAYSIFPNSFSTFQRKIMLLRAKQLRQGAATAQRSRSRC